MNAYSIVNFNRLHPGLIFDPDHYHPERLIALASLSKRASKRVSDYFDEITVLRPAGPNPAGNPVFDLTDALGWMLADGEHPTEIASTKKIAQPGDIVISRLRSYLEEICLIPSRDTDLEPLFSTEFIVLRAKDGLARAWLLPYLLSEPVQTVLRWSQTGSNHPRFAANTLLNLPIPDAVIRDSDTLSSLVRDAVDKFEASRNLYPEAEQELLDRLGWSNIKNKTDKLFFVEPFLKTTQHARVDAEHFQPKYLRLREQLKSLGSSRIGDFCPTPCRGVQPIFIADGDVWVLASKAIRPQGVALDEDGRTSRVFWKEPANEKAHVRSGDVLLNSTGVGTLGRASFYLDEAAALADNHVAILRPDSSVCHPVYLSLFLNTAAGLWQSEMFQTGSSGQLEIYPQHIEDILVFLPRNKNSSIDLAWQHKLADKVTGANRAKQEAQEMLQNAKMIVEGAVGYVRN